MEGKDPEVDKKVINVLGPLFTLYKEKVEEFDQLREIYTDDKKIYVTVSLILYSLDFELQLRATWSVRFATI